MRLRRITLAGVAVCAACASTPAPVRTSTSETPDCSSRPAVGPGFLRADLIERWTQHASDERVRDARGRLGFVAVQYAIHVDLDCDGVDDLLLAGWRPVHGYPDPAAALGIALLSASGGIRSASLWASSLEEVLDTPVLFADLDGDGFRDVVAQAADSDLDMTTVVYLPRSEAIMRLRRGASNAVPVTGAASICTDSLRVDVLPRALGQRPLVRVPVHPEFGTPVAGCGYSRASFEVFAGGLELVPRSSAAGSSGLP